MKRSYACMVSGMASSPARHKNDEGGGLSSDEDLEEFLPVALELASIQERGQRYVRPASKFERLLPRPSQSLNTATVGVQTGSSINSGASFPESQGSACPGNVFQDTASSKTKVEIVGAISNDNDLKLPASSPVPASGPVSAPGPAASPRVNHVMILPEGTGAAEVVGNTLMLPSPKLEGAVLGAVESLDEEVAETTGDSRAVNVSDGGFSLVKTTDGETLVGNIPTGAEELSFSSCSAGAALVQGETFPALSTAIVDGGCVDHNIAPTADSPSAGCPPQSIPPAADSLSACFMGPEDTKPAGEPAPASPPTSTQKDGHLEHGHTPAVAAGVTQEQDWRSKAAQLEQQLLERRQAEEQLQRRIFELESRVAMMGGTLHTLLKCQDPLDKSYIFVVPSFSHVSDILLDRLELFMQYLESTWPLCWLVPIVEIVFRFAGLLH